jgi:subtilisin family serine protease
MSDPHLPAWSLPSDAARALAVPAPWPGAPSRDWAFGGSTGAGVRVCILDSGVEGGHPSVGEVQSSIAIVAREDGEPEAVQDDEARDVCGHGTACAGIVRALAPDCELHSVRVLGEGMTGSGELILAGLRYAVEQGFDVVNMSLSTTKRRFAEVLHDLADTAYFQRTVLVASAHNLPVESYPWRFSSVISVGSHEAADSLVWYANPSPPVELFARGVDVDVAWLNGSTLRCSGNSFAAPHVSGIAALVLAKHPDLTPFQLKSVLYATATNAGGDA